MLYILTFILFFSLTGAIFYLIYKLNRKSKSVASSALGITIAIFTSFLMSRTIVVFADSKLNPAPTIYLKESKVKLKGNETSGTIKGKTSPKATIKVLQKNAVIFELNANKDGKFVIKNLSNNSKLQLTSSRNGKTSKKYNIFISKISDTAITKFAFSNDDDSYKIKSNQDNRAKVSGKTNSNATVRIKNLDGKLLDTLKADKKGNWSVTVDGPGLDNDSPNKVEYEFSTKSGKLKENGGNYLTVVKFKEKTKENKQPLEEAKEETTKETSNTTEPTTTQNSAPQVPAEYLTALNNARDYLNYTSMSKRGLYEQLTSEYGEKFPAEAAQYAIDNLTTDWNLQALKCAKDYQKNINMSNNEIYDQLTSEYGEKFEPAEASYAIQHLND